jgi:glycosyltransferase involved in cell wall biosynthesis
MAAEFARRGHDVLLFGNVDDGPSASGWTGVRIDTESDVLSPGKLDRLLSCDAVSEWTHAKFARLARIKNYRATVMWTDTRDESGRNIYPSEAVRTAFNKAPAGTTYGNIKDENAPVVPIGIPTDGVALSAGGGGYVALGRIAPYKGQDLSVRTARFAGVPLTVSGHAGRFADPYFSLVVAKMCRDAGFGFVADPPDLDALLDGADGLLHTHRWIESFSIVAAQALVRGIPVLTTDVGAVQEWVRACDGGMVVPLKDLEAGRWEAAGIRDFFETNWKGRRDGIAKRARDLFDVRHVADRYLELWGED